MGDPRLERVSALVGAARLLPAEAREPFVRIACGDEPPLIAAILEQLDADSAAPTRDTTGDTLQTCGLPSPAPVPSAEPIATPSISVDSHAFFRSEASGGVDGSIGRYRIIEVLGEGGQGVVYRAHDREGRREVALKVIKPGMDTKQVLARFDAEKNALSMMDHPNIARVYDSGQTAEGRPYFVLEYVAGTPLTEYCKREQLALNARLELFQAICDGVQHAHMKSVVHRDLKPSNIVVTRVDGKPVPKIIDFGLAKALGPRLSDLTVVSLHRQVLGTLDYMSPEQAGSGGTSVDTRTDVYALGVILYELLVDRRPFDLRSQAEDEAYRIIREQDPLRPSSQLSRLTDEENVRLAEDRRLDVGRLRSCLARELDWIVLKALDKQRDRRYSTPLELAADIARHLSGSEPVIARPPSAVYRFRKFSRKYRGALASTGLVFAALVAGLSWVWVERGRAVEERERADAARQELLGLADERRLREARREADALWPLVPGVRPQLERWLKRVPAVLARRSEHEQILATLRQRATAWTPDEQQNDRSTHPQLQELETAREELSRLLGGGKAPSGSMGVPELHEEQETADLRTKRLGLTQRIRDLEAVVSERRTYTFRNELGEQDEDMQWQHDTRAELVSALRQFAEGDRFTGGVPSVQWRLAEINRLEHESLKSDAAKARWAECIGDIAADAEIYRNLELLPQYGLLPLERNARTRLWEFVHLATGVEPQPHPEWRPSEAQQVVTEHFSRWRITGETGVILVLIPTGRFLMGAKQPSLEVEFEDAALRVTRVPAGSVGALLGLNLGDVVQRVNEADVATVADLQDAMRLLVSGSSLQVTVERTSRTRRMPPREQLGRRGRKRRVPGRGS
ncbi:MAG: protein kinase [Planctomycetota bacterium]